MRKILILAVLCTLLLLAITSDVAEAQRGRGGFGGGRGGGRGGFGGGRGGGRGGFGGGRGGGRGGFGGGRGGFGGGRRG